MRYNVDVKIKQRCVRIHNIQISVNRGKRKIMFAKKLSLLWYFNNKNIRYKIKITRYPVGCDLAWTQNFYIADQNTILSFETEGGSSYIMIEIQWVWICPYKDSKVVTLHSIAGGIQLHELSFWICAWKPYACIIALF